MKFNNDVLLRYMSMAPLALAFERALEYRIYQKLPFTPPVLDIGCGDGLFAKVLFAEKIDTGVDPNRRELERARQLGAYDELIQCTGDAIPKPDGFYNTIFSNSALEHIRELEPVFREVHRLLAPGGLFYFTVPSQFFDQYTVVNQLLMALGLSRLAARYRQFYNSFWKQYHYYSLEGWEALARQSGFEMVESYTYDPKRICQLNDFLVPFSFLGVLTKRLTNRWVLFPAVRRKMVYPLYLLARRILRGGERVEQGGLVFITLTKVDCK